MKRLLWIPAVLAICFAGYGCDEHRHRNDHHYDEGTTGVGFDRAPIPAGLYSVTGDGAVELHWAPIRGAGVLGYNVYRSSEYDGTYDWIAKRVGESNASYVDGNGENGVTYFYAVDSYTQDETSNLSFEEVADTPRPEGAQLRIYDVDQLPEESGIDFGEVLDASYDLRDELVVPWNAQYASYYVMELDGLLRLVPTEVFVDGESFWNDLQDFGFTDGLDDVNFAPAEGWSLDPVGVELILGHSYILWTWDDYYAKLRVVELTDTYVVVDWALQTSDDEIERYQLKNRAGSERKWNRPATRG